MWGLLTPIAWVSGLAREQKDEYEAAERELNQCLTISPRLTRCAVALVHLQAHRGHGVEAEKGATALSNGEGELTVARVYQHDYSIPWALVDPRFDDLRKDPEFLAEVERITSKP